MKTPHFSRSSIPNFLTFNLLAFLLVCGSALAAEVPADAWAKLPPHPRLFARPEKWESLKAQVVDDPVSRHLFALIKERAENVLTLPSLDLPSKGINLHGPMRQMQGRIAGLAMTYRLTGDARFLTRARQEMNELATTPHWRPGHFLSCSEATVAMAIGLDWLHDELTPEERARFAAAIVEKGLNPSLEAEKKNESWLISGGNWGPVCHGGLALGALAIAERAPELARQIVNRSLNAVKFAAAKYAPAGAHHEGPGYWAYGSNFYFMFADALRSVFGTMFDLEKAPGLMKTGDFNLQMTTPTGTMFTYGDSVPEFGFEPVMFWFARELKQHYLAAPTLEQLEPMRKILVSDGAMPDASRLQPLALLWWDPSLRPQPGKVVGPLTWWSEGGPQLAVMRSAWSDPRATYVGIKAGKAATGHGHMDAGSFILEANGVRWAVDLGRDQYSGPRQHGLGEDLFREHQDSKRWAIYNDGPESHNILRFNSAAPWVEGNAELRPAKHADITAGFVADLTPAYAGQVKSVARGYSLRPDHSVVIRDEWTTGDRATLVTAQWMTYAKVALEKDGALLTQNGETLRLRVSPSGAHLAVEDWSKAPNAWDSAHPGLSRIVIRVSTAARTAGQLVVVAESSEKPGRADPLKTLSLSDW